MDAIRNTDTMRDAGETPNIGATPNAGTMRDAGATPNIGAIPNAGTTPNTGATRTAGETLNAGATPNAGETPDADATPYAGTLSNTSTMSDAEPPILPRPRMPIAQRAKIFIPFDPLKGYQEALRAKEREAEARMNERVRLDDPA